jgi:hypothetical protein
MTDHDPFLFTVFMFALFSPMGVLAYLWGRNTGTLNERRRCMRLGVGAIHKRGNSSTLRWVLNAIDDGRPSLLPEEEFFDE